MKTVNNSYKPMITNLASKHQGHRFGEKWFLLNLQPNSKFTVIAAINNQNQGEYPEYVPRAYDKKSVERYFA